MQRHVAVIGSTAMGTTLAHVIANGNHACVLWCPEAGVAREIEERHTNVRCFPNRLAPSLRATSNLEEAVLRAAVVIFAVPSPMLRGVARAAARFVEADQVLLSATKGMEARSHKRMSEILAEEACSERIGAIGGPNIPLDIMNRSPTAIVLGTRSRAAAEISAFYLGAAPLSVYWNADVLGVELAGVFKNAVAVAAGIANGLGWAHNTQSLVITRGYAESVRLAAALGANAQTFYGLAGLGDLFVTSTSPSSLNRRLGIELGEGRALPEILANMAEVPEGLNSVHACHELGLECRVAVPIADFAYHVILDTENVHLEAALASSTSLGSYADIPCSEMAGIPVHGGS